MVGDIVKQMCQGIDQTKGIIVFITRRYLKKVNGEDASDNCKLEFNYASRRKISSKMVAVVMDKSMHDTKTWTRSVGMHLGGEMYVDMSGNLENKTYLKQQLKLLQKQLQSKGIQPFSGVLYSDFIFQYIHQPPPLIKTFLLIRILETFQSPTTEPLGSPVYLALESTLQVTIEIIHLLHTYAKSSEKITFLTP